MASSPMNVHDPMGNSHSKGRTKEKRLIEKQGASTFNSRDENDGDEEIEDGVLKDFHELKLKKQEEMKNIRDVIKPKLDDKKEGDVEEERSIQTVHGTSNGRPSSDQWQSMLNVVVEAQHRNLRKNHASTQDTVSGDDGRDPGSTFDDGHEQQSDLNQANGTCDIADGADCSIYDLELRESYTSNSLGQGTGSFSSCQDKPNTNPRTNSNCGNEGAESIRETPAQRKTPEEQNDYSRTSSVPPTPQSKIESRTPETAQIVPGANLKGLGEDEEEKKGYEQLNMSEVIKEYFGLLEKLSIYLDHEMGVTRCWKHLAHVMGIPSNITRRFEMYFDHSPTEDLFEHLIMTSHTKYDVKELKQKLQKIHRNDLIESLNTGLFKDDMEVGHLISSETKFIELLSQELDINSGTIGNWRSLASEFGITKQVAEKFGSCGPGPSEVLFQYIPTKLYNLTMLGLQDHFEGMGRKDLVNLLKKGFENKSIKGSTLFRDMVNLPLLTEIGDRLDKDIPTIKNWRDLAYRLEISPQTYELFDSSKAKAKSPTKMMFEYLAVCEPNLSVGDLLRGIKKIGRNDVVELVTKEAEKIFLEIEDRNAAAQQSTEQLHSKKDKEKCLISNLKKKASIKGLIIHGNSGEGNCMFHALSRQLEIKLGLKISHGDLRKEIVEYLENHRELPKVGDLFPFICDKKSWREFLDEMAEDGTGGNHVVLVAAANRYHTPIRVISSVTYHEDILVTPSYTSSQDTEPLVLGHEFENHYVSLEQNSMSGLQDLAQRNYPSNGSYISSGSQGLGLCQKSQTKRVPLSDKERLAIRVRQLPVDVYRKVCEKLSVKRSTTFDDIRMVAEKLGMDRATIEFLGQQSNPGDVMFSLFKRNLQVDHLITILHEMKRFDIAAVLEDWVVTGNLLFEEERIATRVRQLPVEVYRKVCVKLNVKRSMTFDDFRMVAEKLGMDRDTVEFLGQQNNPADVMFSKFGRNLQVDELIRILHEMERFDIVPVLKGWVITGNLNQS